MNFRRSNLVNHARRFAVCVIVVLSTLILVGCGSDDPARPVSGGNEALEDWVRTNGPPGSEVRAVAFNDAGDIFAGTSSGAFRSKDNGVTWTMINDGIAPNNDDVPTTIYSLFAGANGLLLAGSSEGCSWSVDNGDTWASSVLADLYSGSIKNIVRNPQGEIFAILNGTLIQSTDDGRTWSGVGDGSAALGVLACNGSGTLIAEIYGEGVSTSVDGGQTWTPIGPSTSYLSFLAIDSQGYKYAAPYSDSNLPMGIYRSLLGGEDWEYLDLGLTGGYRLLRMAFGVAGVMFINVDLFSDDGGGVYRSTDSGQSWQQVHQGLTDYRNLRCLTMSPDGHLYGGTEHGLFRSENSGDQWDLIGVPGSAVNSLYSTDSNFLFAGTFWEFDVGQLFRSPDYGATWIKADAGLQGAIVGDMITLAGGGLLVGTSRGLFRSDDEGLNWAPAGLSDLWVSVLQQFSGDLIYASWVDVYGSRAPGFGVSDDGGVTWSTLAEIQASAVAGNAEFLFVGAEANVYRSSDQGITWTSAAIPAWVFHLGFSPDGTLLAGTRDGLFRSIDDGLTWQASGFSSMRVYDFIVDRQGVQLAGTASGLFESLDQGLTWTLADPLLEGVSVPALQLHHTGDVFAGSYFYGVLRTGP